MPFLTPLRVELVDPLAHDGQGEWALLAPLMYEDKHGDMWTVPVGFATDFASVPRAPFAYWLYGNRAHAPAVLHDWACRTEVCPRERADELFLEAMESIGMKPSHVGAMYRAVAGHTRNLAARLNPWGHHD
jgi:hypothetical protein